MLGTCSTTRWCPGGQSPRETTRVPLRHWHPPRRPGKALQRHRRPPASTRASLAASKAPTRSPAQQPTQGRIPRRGSPAIETCPVQGPQNKRRLRDQRASPPEAGRAAPRSTATHKTGPFVCCDRWRCARHGAVLANEEIPRPPSGSSPQKMAPARRDKRISDAARTVQNPGATPGPLLLSNNRPPPAVYTTAYLRCE